MGRGWGGVWCNHGSYISHTFRVQIISNCCRCFRILYMVHKTLILARVIVVIILFNLLARNKVSQFTVLILTLSKVISIRTSMLLVIYQDIQDMEARSSRCLFLLFFHSKTRQQDSHTSMTRPTSHSKKCLCAQEVPQLHSQWIHACDPARQGHEASG